MSKLNIAGVVKKIKSKANPYLPILEAIVNSIDSIKETGRKDGDIKVFIIRENYCKDENGKSISIPPVKSIKVVDNGIGFNLKNRDSFDTFYSDMKVSKGGKGFGRFMYLKYFTEVKVDSIYRENDKFYEKTFRFGKLYDIIEDEDDNETIATDTTTTLFLNDLLESKYMDKGIDTIARKLLENLLIFFVDDSYKCPTISVIDQSNGDLVVLNDYLNEGKDIQRVAPKSFICNSSLSDFDKGYSFEVVAFKIYYANKQKSKILLTGNNREVTDTLLSQYIPEFEDDFYDIEKNEGNTISRNYIVLSYVTGDYLNDNVSLEREAFDFSKESEDMYYPLSQVTIERGAAEVLREVFADEVLVRENKKMDRIICYINDTAPWHREYLSKLELKTIPYHASEEEIEVALQKEKYKVENKNRKAVKEILSGDQDFDDKVMALIGSLTQTGKDDLAHYVCTRRSVLELFKKLLKRREDGKAELEKEIHNLIFPMGGTSETTPYENHNLWLLDERLVFSEYIASDKKISKTSAPTEPDLVIFDKKRSFRFGDNEYSNPLTVFEFKRPKRSEYSDSDNPITQIGDYVEEIRAGKYETPGGVEKVKVNNNTPVFGYIICDPCKRIDDFAKQCSLSKKPDDEGYFGFHQGYNMYIEIISFKRLVGNAELRNKIFFRKLKIE